MINKNNTSTALDISWVLLMIITTANVFVAETAEPSLAIT